MRSSQRVWALALMVVLGMALSACDTFTNSQQVGELETNVAQMQGTIEIMGTPAATAAALQMTADRAMVLQAELNSVQSTTIALQGTLTQLQLGGAPPRVTPQSGAGGGTSGQTDQVGTPSGAPEPASGSGTTFIGTTTSYAVREQDGCAAQASAIFEAGTPEIYVVTTINNLEAGSTLGVRWFSAGALYADEPQCWVPQNDWEQVCAWCALVPQGAEFPAGNWTVELTLDGELMAQTSFQVAGAAADQVTSEPGAAQ